MTKYRAKPTSVDGIRFASAMEARRYRELKLLERAGVIHDLKLQVPFILTVNGVKLGKYVSDFTYEEDGQVVVEDTKGFATPLYRWKARHMKAQYGITIRETQA